MRKGYWDNFGFSRSLAVTYVRTAAAGEWVVMEVEVSFAVSFVDFGRGGGGRWDADG